MKEEMKKEMKIVYKVTNQETGKVYVGATSKSIEKRKEDHLQKAQKKGGTYFQEAISTYGPDAFTWEQIDSATTSNELAEKEKKYILKYDSKENGYNSDAGGGFKKSIYQFDLEGNFIASFKSLKDIELTLNYDKRRVSNACINGTLWKGYFWSYSQNNTFDPPKDNRKRKVLQYRMSGEIIATYISASEASRKTGISKTCITRCCRGERKNSGGYIWEYL